MEDRKSERGNKILPDSGVANTEPAPYNQLHGKEGGLVTEVMEKLQQLQIPQHQLEKLGLSKNWQQQVSPDFVAKAIKAAEKHKGVLKELAKY